MDGMNGLSVVASEYRMDVPFPSGSLQERKYWMDVGELPRLLDCRPADSRGTTATNEGGRSTEYDTANGRMKGLRVYHTEYGVVSYCVE